MSQGMRTTPLASLSLVFQTPSRHCPFRHLNGATVVVEDVRYGRWVRRLGAYSALYIVRPTSAPYTLFSAFLDELFVVPRV